jgi:hypothetical protein
MIQTACHFPEIGLALEGLDRRRLPDLQWHGVTETENLPIFGMEVGINASICGWRDNAPQFPVMPILFTLP